MPAIAILTGASSGIGAAAAQQFMDRGDTVINISRRNCPVAGVETLALTSATPNPSRQPALPSRSVSGASQMIRSASCITRH